MKCAIVVLALCGLSAAAPEADPQLLLNNAAVLPARAALFNPFFRSQVVSSPLPVAAVNALPAPVAPAVVASPAPVFRAAPAVVAAPAPVFRAAPAVVAAPALRAALPLSATPAATVVAPAARADTVSLPGVECASLEGCAVLSLLKSGAAVSRHARAAEPEAEADPQLLAYNNFALSPYAATYSPYAAYSGLYNPYSYGVYNNLALNSYNLGYAAGAPLLNYAAAPAIAPAPVVAAAPAIAAPVVKTIEAAAPVVAAPAPVVVKAAPAVVAAAPAPVVVKAAPLPVVRAPVVETEVKKVTYTHIGRHPVHPTDVFETKQRVLY